MALKLNGIWLFMIVIAGLFSLLYLWFTLFPGQPGPEAEQFFNRQQIDQGREYALGSRLVFISAFITQIIFLIWFVFGGKAEALSRWLQQFFGNNLMTYVLFFMVLWLILRLINLPFDLFNSYYWQHHWGFATQAIGGWWLDYLRSAILSVTLSAVGIALLFWAINRWPGTWWLIAACFISVFMIMQSFLWPILFSPLFNNFEPVNDQEISAMVQELAQKADIQVDQVLVMDASQRTTKANAYFTGLGSTKRIVLYDNLLADYSPEQVKAVVAHEIAHWRQGHIVQGLALSILANIIFWWLIFIVLKATIPGMLTYGRFPPYSWAVILLCSALISFASSPINSYFSRQWEFEADQISIQLTEDAVAAEQLQLDLAAKNISDVAPPAFIEWFSHSHPSAVERVEAIRQIDTQ